MHNPHSHNTSKIFGGIFTQFRLIEYNSLAVKELHPLFSIEIGIRGLQGAVPIDYDIVNGTFQQEFLPSLWHPIATATDLTEDLSDES